MELKPEQAQVVREAFARGKEAEQQYLTGLPVTANLLSGTKASHAMRLTPDEKARLDHLRAIRDALASASEVTRMILVGTLANDKYARNAADGSLAAQPDDWLDVVDEQIRLLETSGDTQHIGDELVSRGYLTESEVVARDFSAAGLHTQYARREAVEVLRQIWKSRHGTGSDARGSYENRSDETEDFYRFNAFVSFVGTNLLLIDPTLETGRKAPRRQSDPTSARTGFEQACYRAWLILGELSE